MYRACDWFLNLKKLNIFFRLRLAALGLDNEQPDYDMDSEDETLLNRLNRKMEIKPLQFETMVDRLEKASTNQVCLPALFLVFVFARLILDLDVCSIA